MAVLLIEQNIGVATAVADHVAIMVNGRINRVMAAAALAADRDLQQRLLGVGRHADEAPALAAAEAANVEAARRRGLPRRARRRGDAAERRAGRRLPPGHRIAEPLERAGHRPCAQAAVERTAPADDAEEGLRHAARRADRPHRAGRRHLRHQGPGAALHRRPAEGARHPVRTVDLSTSGKPSSADVPAHAGGRHASARAVARSCHGDRGSRWRRWRTPSRAGSCASAHRRRHLGRRLRRHHARHRRHARAAGRHAQDHGLDGRFRRRRQLCRRRRHHDVPFGRRRAGPELDHRADAWQRRACAGRHDRAAADGRGARGEAQAGAAGARHHHVRRHHAGRAGGHRRLEADYDCLVFHATGIGGRSMESLADSGCCRRFIDLTTTEVADMLVGGVFPATEDRFGAAIRTEPALCRLGRRARHGQFRPARHGAGEIPQPQIRRSTIRTSR